MIEYRSILENAMAFRWVEGAVTRIRQDMDTGWRTLPYAVTLQLRGGPGEMKFAEGPTQTIANGEAAFIPPRRSHRINLPAPTCSHWAHFDVTLFGAIDVFTLLEVPTILTGRTAREIGTFCEALARTKRETESFGTAMRNQAWGSQLAATILEQASPKPEAHRKWSGLKRLQPVLTYLQEHLAEPISRTDLARLLSLSPQWFHCVFSEIMGEAPVAYLNRLRIEKASRLLIATSLPISEVSRSAGYEDALHFSRTFKNKTGVSPRAYRQNHAQTLRFS